MSSFTRLPDAEFDVMQIVWSQPAPVSSLRVTALATQVKKWKPPTVLTLLNRLTVRGFLSSEKIGKERYYTPLVSQESYLRDETEYFIKRFHKDTITGLMNALYAGKQPSERDLREIEQWLTERK